MFLYILPCTYPALGFSPNKPYPNSIMCETHSVTVDEKKLFCVIFTKYGNLVMLGRSLVKNYRVQKNLESSVRLLFI